jgi:hypothetical protein
MVFLQKNLTVDGDTLNQMEALEERKWELGDVEETTPDDQSHFPGSARSKISRRNFG